MVMMETEPDNQNASFSHIQFLMFGFPELNKHRTLLVIPFLLVYVAILMGNSLIIYRIWVEKTLQSPMYTLISLLFAANVSCTHAIMPQFLLSLVFRIFISLDTCLTQMFFIYLTTSLESAIILLMALDRYVAIRRPLRYHNIMTNRFLVLLVFIGLLRSIFLVSPIIITASKVQFCGKNVLQSIACENMALLKLGCGDMSKMHITGLIIRFLIAGIDGSLILIAYLDILRTTMKIVRGQDLGKALHTCGSHLMVAILIHTCGITSSIVYRIADAMTIAVNIQNLVSAIYFLFPAIVNPIIYGLRVKEIKICLVKSYGWKKNTNQPYQGKATKTLTKTISSDGSSNFSGGTMLFATTPLKNVH